MFKTDKLVDIITDLIDNIITDYKTNDCYVEDLIWDNINESLIYTADLWEIYRYYCDIGDSTDLMYDRLYTDLYTICNNIIKNEESEN